MVRLFESCEYWTSLALWAGVDDVLDLPDGDDACQRLLHLLAGEGLRGVPHGTVGGHNGLWSHVVGVVTSFHALRTGTGEKG